MKEAIATAGEAEVILGFIPKPLFDAAPKLRWVHCIASGMDMFLYPDMKASSVVLTGEKGLVGGHLADTGFGLLLALTRQIATAIRLGPEAWSRREAMRMVEIELEGLTMGVVGFGGTGPGDGEARRGVRHGRHRVRRRGRPAVRRRGRGVVDGSARRPARRERRRRRRARRSRPRRGVCSTTSASRR